MTAAKPATNTRVDEQDPLQRPSTLIDRRAAERIYTACCVCGGPLPPRHIYVCLECGKQREERARP